MLDELLLQHLRFDAEHNPDASRRALYAALLRSLDDNESALVDSLAAAAARGLTPRHLANLVVHCVEYLLLSDAVTTTRAYRTFDVADWNSIVLTILHDEKLLLLFRRLLMERLSQTNKYQRYCGANFVLTRLFGARPLIVGDVGCSLNMGLLGLATGKPFLTMIDHTVDESVQRARLARLELGVGVDIADLKESEDWAIACSFYPSESDEIDEFRADMGARRETARNVKFVHGSFMELSRIWADQRFPLADAVIACTVLYQLPEDARREFFEQVHPVLHDVGVLVISDFVDIHAGRLRWAEPWDAGDKRYRTIVLRRTSAGFASPSETLVWGSSRCREVWPGADY